MQIWHKHLLYPFKHCSVLKKRKKLDYYYFFVCFIILLSYIYKKNKFKSFIIITELVSKPSITQDFITAIKAGSQSLGKVSTLISNIQHILVGQLAKVNATSTQETLSKLI